MCICSCATFVCFSVSLNWSKHRLDSCRWRGLEAEVSSVSSSLSFFCVFVSLVVPDPSCQMCWSYVCWDNQRRQQATNVPDACRDCFVCVCQQLIIYIYIHLFFFPNARILLVVIHLFFFSLLFLSYFRADRLFFCVLLLLFGVFSVFFFFYDCKRRFRVLLLS